MDIAPDGHAQTAGESLEDSLYLVMLILSLSLDIEVDLGRIAQTLEEVEEHLRGEVADFLSLELSIPDEPRTSAEVKGHLAQTIIHRQTEAIALDSTFVAKSLTDAFAQHDTRILDGVMLVNVEVTLGLHSEVDHTVAANLVEHMVEETNARLDVGLSTTVEVQLHVDIRLAGGAPQFSFALSGENQLGNLLPSHTVAAQNQRLAPQILRKLGVGISVADDIAIGQVVLGIVHIFRQHTSSGLTCGRIIFGKMAVYLDIIEFNPLAFQRVENEILHRPEGIFRKRWRTESVLIADHDEAEVRMGAQETEGTDNPRHEFQFLKAVDLLVGRFLANCAVAVDKQYTLCFTHISGILHNPISFRLFLAAVRQVPGPLSSSDLSRRASKWQ